MNNNEMIANNEELAKTLQDAANNVFDLAKNSNKNTWSCTSIRQDDEGIKVITLVATYVDITKETQQGK